MFGLDSVKTRICSQPDQSSRSIGAMIGAMKPRRGPSNGWSHHSVDRATVVAWIRRISTAGLLVALVSPALRNQDSLPLSTYPMYSSTRSNLSTYVTATGVDENGVRTTLSALTIAASRDRLIAQSFLNDAVERGDAEEICVEIASRVDRTLVGVEIARERHDTIARIRGEPSLLLREVQASCEVAG